MNEKKLTLTISTSDRRFSIKLFPDECHHRFDEIVRAMLGEANTSELPKAPLDTSETPSDPPHDEPVVRGPVMEKLLTPGRTYKGFIYARCQHCGDVRGFYEREGIAVHSCRKCGKDTPLEDMVPMRVYCECGKQLRYMTNVTESMVEISCLNCSAPVTLEYNIKHRCYDTIRGRE